MANKFGRVQAFSGGMVYAEHLASIETEFGDRLRIVGSPQSMGLGLDWNLKTHEDEEDNILNYHRRVAAMYYEVSKVFETMEESKAWDVGRVFHKVWPSLSQILLKAWTHDEWSVDDNDPEE